MQENIELVLIFQGVNSGPLDHIRYFSQLVGELYGSGFEEISYSVSLKGKLKSKTMKFTDESIEKFKSDLPDVLYRGFELLALSPGWEYKSRDKKFSLLYNEDFNRRGDRILTFSLNKESFLALYPRDKIIELYLGMARHIQEKEGELVYGFVFSMASEKFPGMFIAGIGNENLTDKEEELLEAWNDVKDQCDRKIRTVFWGDLVTSRHFKRPDNLDQLRKVVGEGNVHVLERSAFFFHLPWDSLELGNENKGVRQKILSVLGE
jgi:hypothetical protein